MVTLLTSERILDGDVSKPVMHRHLLVPTKDSGPFQQNVQVKCFINRYDNNRYAVFDCDFHHHNTYKVYSEQELHDTFDELDVLAVEDIQTISEYELFAATE